MPLLALVVAVAALSVGCRNASVANPTGRGYARITVARQRFEWVGFLVLLVRRGIIPMLS